jgi:hypothetical protein
VNPAPDSGASKKLAGFFIRNIVKLVNAVPDGHKEIFKKSKRKTVKPQRKEKKEANNLPYK